MDSTGDELIPRGKKCNFPLKVSYEHNVEQMMQAKKGIKSYYELRNGVSMASLGDKPYKTTNYAPGYFSEPGMIVGSTNILRKRNEPRKAENEHDGVKCGKLVMAERIQAMKSRDHNRTQNIFAIKHIDKPAGMPAKRNMNTMSQPNGLPKVSPTNNIVYPKAREFVQTTEMKSNRAQQ